VTDSGVLLIGDGDSEAVERILVRAGRTVVRVSDPEEALGAPGGHAVVVIDSVPPPATIADVVKRFRASEGFAGTPVLAITSSSDVEQRIALLEAGADDVMIRPLDERELEARVEALDLRRRRSTTLQGPSLVVSSTKRSGKRLIVVFSPKGGVGTTTVAVNLALALVEGPDHHVVGPGLEQRDSLLDVGR